MMQAGWSESAVDPSGVAMQLPVTVSPYCWHGLLPPVCTRQLSLVEAQESELAANFHSQPQLIAHLSECDHQLLTQIVLLVYRRHSKNSSVVVGG